VGISFFVNSVLLGTGLAMDAFSVSLAGGLREPCMKGHKIAGMAGVFALFQFLMPMIGWVLVSTAAGYFSLFEKCIPWIALILLSFIGGKMLWEGIRGEEESECGCGGSAITFGGMILQGIATSIDALSVGFTISDYNLIQALISCLIIGGVTYLICLGGILIGRGAGTHLAGKSGILGGCILIFIGLEIFITSII